MKKILVVEDSELIRKKITSLLEKNNFEVIAALDSAEKSIEFIEKQKPDLILMDITLSGKIEGTEAAWFIKQVYNIPVIFLTSHKDSITFQKAINSGADGYLYKDSSLNDQLFLQIDFIAKKYEFESALKISELKFRGIANVIQDALIVMDADGNINFWNPAAEKIFGYSQKEAMGKFLHGLVLPDENYSNFKRGFEEFIKSGKGPVLGTSREFFARRKNGDVFPVELSVSELYIDKKWSAVGIVKDISERKAAEQALKKSEKELKEANISKDKFFSIIAHDLRNPLGSFRSSLELLTNEYDFLNDDEKKEFLNSIFDSSKNIYELLDNLLTWARNQRGQIEVHPDRFNLHELTENIFSTTNANAKQKGIELVNSVDKMIYVMADINMISTVLRNLVTNAIKFSFNNSSIVVSSEDNSKSVNISVRDSGIGMKPEQIMKLFSIESTQSTRGTNDEKGTGLGLIICRDFVEKNNGRIWVESSLGHGSIFKFTLPVA